MSRINIRELIVNACDEARLVNRSQPVPGSIFLSAYTLLKKRLDQYSNTNLLSFTRKELNFDPDKNEIVIGEYTLNDGYVEGVNFWTADSVDKLPEPDSSMFNMQSAGQARVGRDIYVVSRYRDTPGSFAYRWTRKCDVTEFPGYDIIPDIEANNIQEIVRVFKQTAGNDNEQWQELDFVSYEDFYSWQNNSNVFTVLPLDDSNVKLMIKNQIKDGNIMLKVMYNEAFDFDQDSELNIPRQYVALFTAGLVYDLAVQYPRLSDSTVAMLKSRLDELEENVRRSSAVNKFIKRDVNKRRVSYADFVSGRFLGV